MNLIKKFMKNIYKCIKLIVIVSLVIICSIVNGQVVDTTNKIPVVKEQVSDTTNKIPVIKEQTDKAPVINTNDIKKNDKDLMYSEMGVAISPSSMHLCIKPGTTVTKEISITNDTKKINKFKMGFSDFAMGRDGKPTTTAKDSKYSLSKWINIVPSYIELKPGEKTKIKLIISIPDSVNYSAWTIVTIDEVNDRPPISAPNNNNTIAMGIIPSIGFGVYIYQNPPNVKINNVDILKFYVDEKNANKCFVMEIKNTGDGIGYSAVYVDITNLSNGKKTRTPSNRFTILPQFSRDLIIKFPEGLTPGKYSAIGVVDFGSKDEINGQELEFSIP